ncbi:NHL repeat-containing protein 2 [Porphyridium purpureum]|uniref:NHL repeat-containing protein 2 n=1 Tax=Porphyridium purpureum TaxID=35688 RepID=A0A5J4Z158_PORPP|nr:NHL repeat-containing protein 2 [Porphyridium purpureum]|eukprot:POR3376..scf208_2
MSGSSDVSSSPKGNESENSPPSKKNDGAFDLVRREVIAAALLSSTFTVIGLASQRNKALRRYSLAGLVAALNSRRIAPNMNLKTFALEGLQTAPRADLSKLVWVNVADAPDLKDRVVVVHIFRASDLNVQETLRRLDKSLRETTAHLPEDARRAAQIISVHSPKFDLEFDSRVVQKTAMQLRLAHPCASDPGLHLWQSVGITDWPAVLVLSPNLFRVLFTLQSDSLSRLGECLSTVLDIYSNTKPTTLGLPVRVSYPALTDSEYTSTVLSFPGKVAVDTAGRRLFISDSGNNRIVVTSLDGSYLTQIGGLQTRLGFRSSDVTQQGHHGGGAPSGGNSGSSSGGAKASSAAGTKTGSASGSTSVSGSASGTIGGGPGVTIKSALGGLGGHPGSHSDGSTSGDAFSRDVFMTAPSESAGFADGTFEDARFRSPQGLAYNKNKDELIVVDTGNKALRVIRFKDGSVSTVGLGSKESRPGMQAVSNGFGDRRRTVANTSIPSYSSPWDIAYGQGTYFLTSPGSNQVWMFDPNTGDIRQLSGRPLGPGLADTENDLTAARFAMPTGICVTKTHVFTVDCDSSTLRQIDVRSQTVSTKVGGDVLFPWNLSAFGDRDGFGPSVRLQYPLGIAVIDDDRLCIADTYNNKIKLIMPKDSECRVLAGQGPRGNRDGAKEMARFDCPSGVAYDTKMQRLYVADRGNHAIRVVDVATGSVSTLRFSNFPLPDERLR